MGYNTIKTESRGKTLVITLNRPEVYNALNSVVIGELEQVFTDFFADQVHAGAILTGEGPKAFAAGADIGEVNAMADGDAVAYSHRGQGVFSLIENGNKPVIAAVNGFALGGGCELAMSCHMRVASENAKFGQPEVNLGLIAGYGGTQRLPRLIGPSKATELLLTADMIKAPEALSLGLVNYVVSPEELMDTCAGILEKIYTKSPLAVGLTLNAIRKGLYEPNAGMAYEADLFGKAVTSHDGREGTQAFLEKREAKFEGR